MKKTAATAVLLFAACAPAPRVFVYPGDPGLTIVTTDRDTVVRHCQSLRTDGHRQDDGKLSTKDDKPNGCWDPNTREMWIDEAQPRVVIHELCHAAGIEPKKCKDDYTWED